MYELYLLKQIAEQEGRPYMQVYRDKAKYVPFHIKQGKRSSVRYLNREDSRQILGM